jgi:hypothetical protein
MGFRATTWGCPYTKIKEYRMSLSDELQLLADALADWATAEEIRHLLRQWGLHEDTSAHLWQESRQATAEAVVAWAEAHGRVPDLRQHLQTNHPTENQLDPHILANLSQLNQWNAIAKGTAHSQTGVLSGSNDAPAANHVHYVNLGFASRSNPSQPLEANWSLETGRLYYFWVEIGALLAGSLTTEEAAIDLSELPDDAVLQVVLFSFPDELGLRQGQTLGRLQRRPGGGLQVAHSPITPPRTPAEMLAKRLFFPIDTPATAGSYRLRCHIYYEQVLLQSHLVTAVVSPTPQPQPEKEPPALQATADYLLCPSLSPSYLAQLPHHKLSIMVNDNGSGTHGFRFFGEGEFVQEATFDAHELQNALKLARGRCAKWHGGMSKSTATAKRIVTMTRPTSTAC